MGFTKLKVKAKINTGRGTIDAMVVMNALKDYWTQLQAAIEALPQDEQDAFKDHFNSCIEGEQGLGDILFGSYDSFESRIKFLDEELQDEYTQELLTQEVLDKDTLEESLRENKQRVA